MCKKGRKGMGGRYQMTRWVGLTMALVAIALLLGCGVEGRKERQRRAAAEQAAAEAEAVAAFEWPGGDRPIATLTVAGMGTIRIALYPELAPKTVENFARLAESDFYVGTTFHRVIPGFMIQGGDPNSKDDNPDNDGFGGPGYQIPDERTPAPHLRGVVSMANTGQTNSGGSQFFILHADAPHLNGHYTAFGRVVDGMDVVDEITEVELDVNGRWGPKNRPIENVVLEKVTVSGVTLAGDQDPEEESQWHS